MVVSSAESRTKGPSECQEPNPDEGMAAASGGVASGAVLRTFCKGGTGDGLNFVQVIRSDPNLDWFFWVFLLLTFYQSGRSGA